MSLNWQSTPISLYYFSLQSFQWNWSGFSCTAVSYFIKFSNFSDKPLPITKLSGPLRTTLLQWGICHPIFFYFCWSTRRLHQPQNVKIFSRTALVTTLNWLWLCSHYVWHDPFHSLLSWMHLLSVYCPLLGAKFCHTCSLVFKARPFGLIKSLVLDSMVLRERHKIGIRRLYWLCHLVFHSNCSMARLKTLIKTKQLDSNCCW